MLKFDALAITFIMFFVIFLFEVLEMLIDRNILARNETFFVSLTKPLMYRFFKTKQKRPK
jgi:hypothetical protein